MRSNALKTVWSNSERSRYFLIPDECELPAGDFQLRTTTGRQQTVDEAALTEYEISREEAKAWLKEQFGQILGSAKTGILDGIKRWRSPQATADQPKSEPANTRPVTALSELEDLLNQSTEQIRAKSTTSFKHLWTIANALNGLFEGAISPEPEGLERAQAQANVLKDSLDALGIQTDIQLETFPERLHNLYFATGQSQTFQENADELDAIANQIEHTAALAVSSIRAMAKQQRKAHNQTKRQPPSTAR
ncbi:MAG: hypothetical protein AAF821_12830 [Cyanobacteria bacterium P01_D01_bin.156]